MGFEFLDHTADIKFRAWGKSVDNAFEEAAKAFSNYISRRKKILAKKKKKIEIEADDYENLLYLFLDELIYLIDAEKFIISKAKVKIKNDKNKLKLKAVLDGDSTKKYQDLDSVKAATYSEIYIKKNGKNWEVQAVLDV